MDYIVYQDQIVSVSDYVTLNYEERELDIQKRTEMMVTDLHIPR